MNQTTTPAASADKAPPLGLDGLAPTDDHPDEHQLGKTGFFATAAGVRQEEYLREHGDQLRAYLLTRLRNTERATDAYEDVSSWLSRQSKAQLAEAPSIQAAYFAAARRFYQAQAAAGVTPAAIDDVPWEPATPGSPHRYGDVLDVVRHGLNEVELELLELRYARRLKVGELSYVLGMPIDKLMVRLEAAVGYTELLVSEVQGAERVPVAHVIYDAFQVVPDALREAYRDRRRTPPALSPGTRVGDRFEVVKCVGGGAFAWVYRARDVHVPGHQVALKVLHRPARTEPARQGAIRELSVIASAFHPSLVQLKEHGWYQDRLWFVMPWYEGETLGARIERDLLSPKEAAGLFASLARALSSLHAAGVVHRDVKPDNIFLAELKNDEGATSEVIPILLDLGVAAPEGDLALAGTPIYFAPEMAQRIVNEDSDVAVTAKADVFALALTFAHSVEGIPALGDIALDTFIAIRAKSPPKAPKLRAKELARALASALELDPAARPSASELAETLSEAAGMVRVHRPRSDRPWLAMLVTLAALGTATYATFEWRSSDQERALLVARDTSLSRELDRQREHVMRLTWEAPLEPETLGEVSPATAVFVPSED